MQAKKRSWQRLLFMVVTILALMMPQTVFATGGTDGTELQVAEPGIAGNPARRRLGRCGI